MYVGISDSKADQINLVNAAQCGKENPQHEVGEEVPAHQIVITNLVLPRETMVNGKL